MFRAGSSTPKPVALLEILHTLLSNRRSVFIMHHLSPPLYITPYQGVSSGRPGPKKTLKSATEILSEFQGLLKLSKILY